MSTDQENRGRWVFIPAVVFCCISPFFTILRCYARFKNDWGLGKDDWAMLVSTIFCMAMNGILIAATRYGYGKPGDSLDHFDKLKALEFFTISQIFYKVTINLTRASIVLLYLRLFPDQRFRKICRAFMVLITLYGIVTTLTTIFQCGPYVPKSWEKSNPNGTCINTTAFWYANGGISILEDFVILVLPVRTLWNLKMPRGSRVAVIALFFLWAFVAVVTTPRMIALRVTANSADPTHDISATGWTVVEANIAIICACLPSCRKLFSCVMPRFFHRSTAPRDEEIELQQRNKKHTPILLNQAQFASYPHPYHGDDVPGPSSQGVLSDFPPKAAFPGTRLPQHTGSREFDHVEHQQRSGSRLDAAGPSKSPEEGHRKPSRANSIRRSLSRASQRVRDHARNSYLKPTLEEGSSSLAQLKQPEDGRTNDSRSSLAAESTNTQSMNDEEAEYSQAAEFPTRFL
ncbi:hypothetical protein BP6252_12974 [Coleophoma cylindrospora]|uniref:Rhodopsin domain-containing protein n=1 Tax=Coleophoma cylindrospora TaxID=1849047 RepID=A0A3D8QDT4_9HELO|nr:hypothetical protein BP6252_12974 [Coleophoma cylindrospora]